MGLNYRHSVKLGKNVRLNFSKSGMGISAGVKGAHVSVGPHGVRKTVGIPGTGIYYTKQSSYKKKAPAESKPTGPLLPMVPAVKKPLSPAGRVGYKIAAVLCFLVAAFFALCGIPLFPVGIALWVCAVVLILCGMGCLKKAKAASTEASGESLDLKNKISGEEAIQSVEANDTQNTTEPVADFIKRTNAQVEAKYDFLTFKVAGVTFKNGRKTRQAILRKIKFQDPPFEPPISISIKPYEYENETAYGVYANDEQIGNIPKDQIQYVKDNWERRDAATAINVYGGGMTDAGEQRNYGAEVTIRFFKEIPKEA